MITIISPAKTLDFDSSYPEVDYTHPDHIDDSEKIIKKLRSLSKKKVSSLMNLSKDLTELNVMRYQEWTPEFSETNSKPALLAFRGEVYRGIGNDQLTQEELNFAQYNLRILSGLHGLLRPLDLIQPYRLEMGTSLPVQPKKNLYQFWSDKITSSLNQALEESQSNTLVNLASNEYAKAVDFKQLNAKVITPVFKDFKNGEYKVVMTWAKHARGVMTGYILRNQLTDPEELKGFEAYQYNERMSTDEEWVFTREP